MCSITQGMKDRYCSVVVVVARAVFCRLKSRIAGDGNILLTISWVRVKRFYNFEHIQHLVCLLSLYTISPLKCLVLSTTRLLWYSWGHKVCKLCTIINFFFDFLNV